MSKLSIRTATWKRGSGHARNVLGKEALHRPGAPHMAHIQCTPLPTNGSFEKSYHPRLSCSGACARQQT